MNPFVFLRPASLDETSGLLSQHGEKAKIIAGGTALITMMKQRLLMPEVLISLERLEECRQIFFANDEIRLGSMMTHQEILTHKRLADQFPVLIETMKSVSNTRVRNVATLGGALAHADPNQDTLVTLLALGAQVNLRNCDDSRILPLSEFFIDYYETKLAPEEIITEICIPMPSAKTGSAFKKFLPRSHEDYGVVSIAASISEHNGTCQNCCIALGCVADTVVRASQAESILIGHPLSKEAIAEAASASTAVTDPISDSRGSRTYKKKMTEVFVRRTLMEAWSRI
ncbi:MAG: xanthine dehydrogenase family protein subunit M [SAR324 cluster bacterium]|nr:xanthine dehydrogenase family protein subunit M [SAR324 cluster bacterium]